MSTADPGPGCRGRGADAAPGTGPLAASGAAAPGDRGVRRPRGRPETFPVPTCARTPRAARRRGSRWTTVARQELAAHMVLDGRAVAGHARPTWSPTSSRCPGRSLPTAAGAGSGCPTAARLLRDWRELLGWRVPRAPGTGASGGGLRDVRLRDAVMFSLIPWQRAAPGAGVGRRRRQRPRSSCGLAARTTTWPSGGAGCWQPWPGWRRPGSGPRRWRCWPGWPGGATTPPAAGCSPTWRWPTGRSIGWHSWWPSCWPRDPADLVAELAGLSRDGGLSRSSRVSGRDCRSGDSSTGR